MKDFLKLIKENRLYSDILNVVSGILLIITIILFCFFPNNKMVIGLMVLMAGFMNISNGLKRYKDIKTRGIGISLLTLGICIFMIGFYILNVL